MVPYEAGARGDWGGDNSIQRRWPPFVSAPTPTIIFRSKSPHCYEIRCGAAGPVLA